MILAQAVIELASAADEEWFNGNRAYYEDVEETVGRVVAGMPELERAPEKALRKPIEGGATGSLVQLTYRMTAQPAPFTLLAPSSKGYSVVDYGGFHVEVRVFPKSAAAGGESVC